jgi:hypothetical protein
MKQKKLRIFLTGGLGNQLFQLAAGIHFANSRQLELDLNTANPRRNQSGVAEVLTLKLPPAVISLNENHGGFVRKILGFNLRSGYSPRGCETNPISRKFQKIFTNLSLSMLLKERFQAGVSRNLGNDSNLKLTSGNQVLIGYFQTHLVTKELIEIKSQLFDGVCELEHSHYRQLAEEENPLLVHVRLGDYLSEESFGVLSLPYYESAIDYAWKENKYRKIWLFSDNPQEALFRIPEAYRSFTRIIMSENLDSAETLRIMTLCKGYIIANSTFSWWAASLREEMDALVIAPTPWFKALDEPRDLIPSKWLRFSGF